MSHTEGNQFYSYQLDWKRKEGSIRIARERLVCQVEDWNHMPSHFMGLLHVENMEKLLAGC